MQNKECTFVRFQVGLSIFVCVRDVDADGTNFLNTYLNSKKLLWLSRPE